MPWTGSAGVLDVVVVLVVEGLLVVVAEEVLVAVLPSNCANMLFNGLGADPAPVVVLEEVVDDVVVVVAVVEGARGPHGFGNG